MDEEKKRLVLSIIIKYATINLFKTFVDMFELKMKVVFEKMITFLLNH